MPEPTEPKIENTEKYHLKEGQTTLSVEYLTGLWNLPREQVLEKILKEKIPYDIVDDKIRVSSDAVPVGGK